MNVDTVIVAKKLPQGPDFKAKESGTLSVALDVTITDELRQRGIVREFIRQINAMRKDAKLTINDSITLYHEIENEELKGILRHYKADLCKDVIASNCLDGIPENIDLKKVLEIAGSTVIFGIKKK